MRRVRVRVTGRVQGVGYRYATVREADARGVAGWVRNRRDGSVEAEVEGDDDAVAAVLAWMREGPAHARVAGIDIDDIPLAGDEGFTSRATA